jgi:membrane protein required for colicin V production
MGNLSITVIDAVVIGVILLSAGFAMWRGLIHETFSIFEWVAGIYAALRFTPVFQPLLRGVISPPWLAYILVLFGTFLIVFIPLSIFSHRLSEVVKKSEIGPVDRALGLVFGLGRGLVIVGLGYIAFAALVPIRDHPATLTQARLFPLIRNTSEVLLGLVPGADKAAGLDARGDARAEGRDGTDGAKTYGASDRSALDNLIETTGRDSSR